MELWKPRTQPRRGAEVEESQVYSPGHCTGTSGGCDVQAKAIQEAGDLGFVTSRKFLEVLEEIRIHIYLLKLK